jgi:tetratricopeptide (TPR) repeat protein
MKQTIFIFLVIIYMCSIGLYAQSTATLLQTSYNAEAAGNYQLAIESIKTLEKNNDADPFYKLRLGWLNYSSGQYQTALDYYTKAASLSGCLEAKEGIINCAYSLGKWEKVISIGNQILAKFPDHYSAMTKTAYSYYVLNNYQGAANIYKRLLGYYQYNLELMGYYLSCQVLLNDMVNAKKTFLQLQKYSPNNPFVVKYAKRFN